MARKYYIILTLAICFGLFAFYQSVEAGVVWFSGKNISVDFDGLPFDLNNFAPGMSNAKSIVIENNEDFDVNIYFKAKKTSGDDILANALTITIDNKSKHLSDLFNNNIILTPVNSGESQDYNITLTFDQDAGNDYQNKTINFDFIITAEEIGKGGKEIPPVVIPGGGGGGGLGLPPGLTILGESVRTTGISETSVTVIWTTSYFSTSQVIYSRSDQHHTLDLDAANYGYAYSKEGDNSGLAKVTSHSVTITGLDPGTTYYYRTVSRASPPTISQEHSFTTLGVKEKIKKEAEKKKMVLGKETEKKPKEIAIRQLGQKPTPSAKAPTAEKEKKPGEMGQLGKEKKEVSARKKLPQPQKFLAAIGALPFNLKVILIIVGIIIIGLIVLWLVRKRKIRKIKT